MPVHLDHPPEHPHVALVRLDRPERGNSLDPGMLCDLSAAWREIADDDETRCAIVTGTGDRVFCSGMDMTTTIPIAQAFARGERVDERSFEGLRSVSTALLAGFDLKKPLLCAINGHARAGGFDMMLASELRYAVPQATFALEEVALGLYPTGNATVMLPRQIGWAHAQDLLLTARAIDAARAAEIGLINEIVEPEALLPRTFEAADAIAANGPIAVRETRRGVREILALDLPEAYLRQEQIGRELRKTEDASEAQRAFVEKRRPVWKNR
jgi:enoyl-CoA hydratase